MRRNNNKTGRPKIPKTLSNLHKTERKIPHQRQKIQNLQDRRLKKEHSTGGPEKEVHSGQGPAENYLTKQSNI